MHMNLLEIKEWKHGFITIILSLPPRSEAVLISSASVSMSDWIIVCRCSNVWIVPFQFTKYSANLHLSTYNDSLLNSTVKGASFFFFFFFFFYFISSLKHGHRHLLSMSNDNSSDIKQFWVVLYFRHFAHLFLNRYITTHNMFGGEL